MAQESVTPEHILMVLDAGWTVIQQEAQRHRGVVVNFYRTVSVPLVAVSFPTLPPIVNVPEQTDIPAVISRSLVSHKILGVNGIVDQQDLESLMLNDQVLLTTGKCESVPGDAAVVVALNQMNGTVQPMLKFTQITKTHIAQMIHSVLGLNH